MKNTLKHIKKNKNIIIIIIIIFLCLQISKKSFSQNNLQKKITIVAKNQPLADILNEISAKADINFSYSNQKINTSQKITLIARNKSVENIFSQLFSDINIKYTVIEKQVILKPDFKKTKKPHNNIIIPEPPKYTINGYLKDEESEEVLIGATVYIKNKKLGTITNAYGFYSISLPKGNYQIEYSYIGYNKKNINIELLKNENISHTLKMDIAELKIISISENNSSDITKSNSMLNLKLSSRDIINKPILAGEFDAIKTLQSITGITSYGDGSVIFNVRGGTKAQNMIFIDEAPIYNPSHLLGFFSAIAPEAINDMKVFKADFPIQYGGRLSSLIDIKTKDGSLKKIGFFGNISPIVGTYSIDGPFVKEKSSFIFTFRNSHINWLYKNTMPELNIRFYDIHTKLNFKLNRNNRIYFSIYSGSDKINLSNSINTNSLSWKNFTSTIRYTHLFSDKLFSNTILYFSKYDYYLYSSVEKNEFWNSFIGNFSFKNDYSYFPNPKNIFRFGYSANIHVFNPGNLNNEYFIRKVSASNVLEFVSYFGHEIHVKDRFSLFYGVRLLNWNNIGPAIIYSYDENYQVNDYQIYGLEKFNSFVNIEPRMNIVFATTKTLSFKLSYNHNIQYLQYLSNSISPFTTLDVWLPANPNIQPQKSNQYTFGIYKKFTEFDITAEMYYKKMNNQLDYANHANMLLNPLIEGELRFGNTTAAGIELSARKQKGDFTMYLAYTYARVFRKTNGVNSGKVYPATYDKPHNININLSYQTAKRWFFTLNWLYSSGNRFSSPTSFFDYKGYTVPIYTQKNNDKLPDYHRLDLSIKFQINKFQSSRFKHDLTFSIFNVYARKNPVAVNFNKIEGDNNNYYIPTNYIIENEIIPTQISLLGFIPSISYQFRFR